MNAGSHATKPLFSTHPIALEGLQFLHPLNARARAYWSENMFRLDSLVFACPLRTRIVPCG